MRTRRVPLKLLAILAALFLVAAACGDDDETATDDTEAAAATDDAATDDEAEEPAEDEAEEPAEEEADPRADWPDSLVLAAVPAEQDAQLQESYRVTREILADELGLEIEFFQAADYAGVIEALIADRVDLAQFGPFSYVIAIANGADAAPVGVMTDGPDVEPGYQSFLVAQADNDEINSLEDIVGKRVCFVDPASTSGFLVPAAGMLEAGIDPDADVNGIFAGGHDASVISVNSGDCDAGFAFDTMVTELLIDRGDIAEGDVKIVWESAIIAGSPMSMRNGLPESLQAEIREIFENKLNVDWAAENGYCDSNDPLLCSFTDENIWGFVPRDDSFYDGVRLICEELGAERAPQCEGIS
ncbi:MAG TPA: phosphate/phosphite/phosphonate ABC transporter substrate-binding protein [Acidimicrobiales bacterium]|nr:phosphate/phosphite/phosphonate ABC transporter substrate-binding protein [Acidimicrobiales bacterium]